MQIFIHSIRLVFQNFGQALRLTLVPYLVITVLTFFAELYVLGNMQWRWPILLLLVPANFLVGLWAAVLWHRYVLLDEATDDWVPRLMWDRVGAYFVRLLIVTLVLCAVGAGAGILVALLSRIGVGYAIAAWIAFAFAALVASYRLMPVAVAAALGRPLTLSEAWIATTGKLRTFVVLSLLTVLILSTYGLAASLLGSMSLILEIVWSVGFGWLLRMILISILTTIYGHFVEQRPIR